MSAFHHLYARCIDCSDAPPVCACSANQICVQTARSCGACATATCVDQPSAAPAKGVSAGAVAGAVVGVVIFAILCALGYLWWRRRQAAKAAVAPPSIEEPKDVPAPAETVLRRPDPMEKPGPVSPRILALAEAAQREAPPTSAQHGHHHAEYDNATSVLELNAAYGLAHGGASLATRSSGNPFADDRSIMTATSAASQGTNVIPIALVNDGDQLSQASSLQPPRPPHVTMNMDHLNVSQDSSINAPAGGSRLSGHSYLTNASFASNLDAVIVTHGQRHVIGQAARADTVSTPLATGSSAAGTSFAVSQQDLLHPNSHTARMPARSPLAATSFGPQDVVREAPESESDPFNDANAPRSPARTSRATFGTNAGSTFSHEPDNSDENTHYTPTLSTAPRPARPVSNLTQAASVIGAELVGAARVQLDYATPVHTPAMASSVGGVHGAHRLTAARLVSPASLSSAGSARSPGGGHFSREQDRAMMEVQAARAAQLQARESALSGLSVGADELAPPHRRGSMSTVASGGRADSILEAFPFVPPSPAPPRQPRSPHTPTASEAGFDGLPLPERRRLGLSTGSEISSVSTGLGGFAFEVESPAPPPEMPAPPPPPVAGLRKKAGNKDGKVRASLDTLALTSDLASYPLGFDRGGQRM